MNKILVAIPLLLASELLIRMLNSSLAPLPAIALQVPLTALPQQIAGWKGKDIALDPRVFASSGANDSVKRVYRSATGQEISLFAGTWLDYPPSVPHRPELCYSTNGWEIAERADVEVTPEKGEAFTARLLTCRNHGQAIHLLYWVDLAGLRTDSDEAVRSVLQVSRGEGSPRPALLKVMLQSGDPDPARAKRDLASFAAQIVPQLEKVQHQGSSVIE